MNFITFFLLLFIISISICISATFYPDILKNILQCISINENIKFVGLFSLILSIFSYIGMIISFYFANKIEKLRVKKLKEDRKNIDEIHEELNSLR